MGGGGKTPDERPMPAPTPVPQPSQTPSEVQTTEGQRASKIKNLKAGVMSTVKTSPQGAMGQGPELNTPQAGGVYEGAANKKNLGA